MLVTEDQDRLLTWISGRIDCFSVDEDARAMGWERGGELVAVVAYEGVTICGMNMHVASDGTRRWLTREFMVHAFAYPFIQCEKQRVTGLIPASNQAALRFNVKLGFRLEGQCREALPGGEDLVVTGMLRRECRYIPPKYRS